MGVYCMQCGTALPTGARFCSNCGTAIHAVPSGAPTPLSRPLAGRQIAGVCAALARSYGWDVAAVRIIAVVITVLSSGLMGIAYLAAWIGIPEDAPSAPGVYPPGV